MVQKACVIPNLDTCKLPSIDVSIYTSHQKYLTAHQQFIIKLLVLD